jgi:serine/threonine protein phosphatase PrpC
VINEDRSEGYAARSDVGRVRRSNEDRFLARPPLFAVADGMGGHEAGEVASAIAVDTLEAALMADGVRDADALVRVLVEANSAIRGRGSSDPALEGMGTTCTAALVGAGSVWLAHVGDSRAYLLRSGTLTQLTRDHSVVAGLVRDGVMNVEEARLDRRRNIITRALGADDRLNVDVTSFEVAAGDRLLLCSDGLIGHVADATMSEVLASEHDPAGAADRLVDLANESGGDDNITVVVIDPAIVAASAAARPATSAAAATAMAEAPSRRPHRRATRARRGLLVLTGGAAVLAIVAIMFQPLAGSEGDRSQPPSSRSVSNPASVGPGSVVPRSTATTDVTVAPPPSGLPSASVSPTPPPVAPPAAPP